MKYILTDESRQVFGRTLHRIKCVEAFGNVNAGDLGGWVESGSNLSQSGDAWVYGDARVYENARVSGDARVYENAQVSGDARVYGNARVYENARVYGDARVSGDAQVSGDARVYGDAWVYENARVYGDARVYENAQVYGDAQVSGDARVKQSSDYAVYKNTWSSQRHFTWTRSNGKWRVGCFFGTSEELIAKAYRDSKLSGDCYKAVVEMRNRLTELETTLSLEDK